MSESLTSIVDELNNLDHGAMSPVEYSRRRENCLVRGLNALAAEYGKEIETTRIEANGDMCFNIKGADRHQQVEYGEELAEVLSLVPRRTGATYVDSPVLPQNNWMWIDHFRVAQLLKLAAEHTPSAAASPDDAGAIPRL